jgi:hypothetical protein
MNRELTKTRSQQRIEQLINAGRPLTDEESDELYRALHADYMRKWRAAKAEAIARRASYHVEIEARQHERELLERLRDEMHQEVAA